MKIIKSLSFFQERRSRKAKALLEAFVSPLDLCIKGDVSAKGPTLSIVCVSVLLFVAPIVCEGQVPNPSTSFNYTITASGTQNITNYPNESFTYGVTATVTETWTQTTIGSQSATRSEERRVGKECRSR